MCESKRKGPCIKAERIIIGFSSTKKFALVLVLELVFCLLCSIPIQMAISRNTPHTQTKKINCARVAVTDVESRDFL